jgi:hypothetical protein
LNNAICYGGLVGIFYFIYQSVAVLAGKATVADIGIKFLAELGISEALAWLLAGGGMLYGFGQRRLRKNTIERLQSRNQSLEQSLDPNRTSSRLTPRGDTRPEDDR